MEELVEPWSGDEGSAASLSSGSHRTDRDLRGGERADALTDHLHDQEFAS